MADWRPSDEVDERDQRQYRSATGSHDALEPYRGASHEQREQEARRRETQVQQLRAELCHANQTAILTQNEITQLNKDNARLVDESGAASISLREARAHGEQIREALDRIRVDHVRFETERDALRATVGSQSGNWKAHVRRSA
ncbi:hypothetical protein [Burkholderia sp. BCC1640]|uniref:hypothetical protein n=1 Tax=Burkholderia sp. BCC1640 TaxID=2676294 RepID=UPI00158E624A|nr:hypothetical protein [Burkholderia sp. BCC1640]